MTTELEKKIIRQIEYYFGDLNLPRDKFMQEKVKEDDGWITLDVLLTFKRLAELSKNPEEIATAVEKSETGLVEVSEDKKKIRRNPDLPIPELNDDRKKELTTRTAYAKGFPLDEALNDIINYLEAHGPIDCCIRRSTKDHKFKGSCFIVFKDIETCKKFIDAESIKYKDIELIRKWQSDYYADKKKEYEEKVKARKDKKQAKLDEKCKKLDYPKGANLQFSNIPDDKTLTREDIKEKFKEYDDINIAFVDYNKGDKDGYLRLTAENAGVEFVKKLNDAGELEINEIKIKFKLLEGEEEEEYLKRTAETVTKLREKQKGNRKRKGGNYGNSRDAKQKKNHKSS